jgi:hypothetical protein
MKRDIEWKEKLDGGIKRTVRISLSGGGKIKWRFKRSDEERWDYDSAPSPDDWLALEEKVKALYNRRRAALKDVELVQKMRMQHG